MIKFKMKANKKTLKILFLGFYMNKKDAEGIIYKDKWPQIQTLNFLDRLIESLTFNNNAFDIDFLSTPPVTDYPNHPQKMFKRKKSKAQIGNWRHEITYISFLNISILKIFTRLYSFVAEGLRLRKRNKPTVVICFSIHLPILVAGYILAKLNKVPMIGIWTDPPNVPNSFDGLLKQHLRKIEERCVKLFMKKCDAVIALTPDLAKDFSNSKAHKLIVNGFSPVVDTVPSFVTNEKVIITHVGSLMERYGIRLIVEAFEALNLEKVELRLYGVGDLEDYLTSKSKLNRNIKYMGFLQPEKVKRVLGQSDFLINIRDPDFDLVRYSFPSKMLEYAASGTPTISTILPSFPSGLNSSLIKVKEYNIAGIQDAILSAINLSEQEYQKLRDSSIQFSRSMSPQNQSSELQSFIWKVASS